MYSINPEAATKNLQKVLRLNEPTKEIKWDHKKYSLNQKKAAKEEKETNNREDT